jgi:hypothetical protein
MNIPIALICYFAFFATTESVINFIGQNVFLMNLMDEGLMLPFIFLVVTITSVASYQGAFKLGHIAYTYCYGNTES